MVERPRALFAMRSEHLPQLFPPRLMRRLQELADIDEGLVVEDFADPRIDGLLSGVEVMVTGWGCPPLGADVLDRATSLRAVLHSAGSVKHLFDSSGWARGLVVSSAAGANAVPVAEYTLAAILLSGKGILDMRERYRARRGFTPTEIQSGVGNFGLRAGIIGASRIGRRVIELLRPFDIEVCLSDPYVDDAEVESLGVLPLPLEKLLATSDVVSVNAPYTAETHHLIDAGGLALMRDGATLINTARGMLVDTEALTAELVRGRLSAVLDVTEPEPLPADSPLFGLPNVFLTPHVAGSHGNELERMGLCVVDELERLVTGRPLLHRVDHTLLERQA